MQCVSTVLSTENIAVNKTDIVSAPKKVEGDSQITIYYEDKLMIKGEITLEHLFFSLVFSFLFE